MTKRVAVVGARGRLGSVISEVVDAHDGFELSVRAGSTTPEREIASCDLLIDATTPETSPAIVRAAVERGQRVIVGTSGWSQDRVDDLRELVENTPGASVIVVPNFSLGSVLGTTLAQIAAPFFDAVEIIETHHPQKIDSPSGTAVRTAELIAESREGRSIEAPFAEQEARGTLVAGVPVHSLRLAGVIASQEVRFGGVGETLTVTHNTVSSDSYRAGIKAALGAIFAHEGLTVGLDRVLGVRA